MTKNPILNALAAIVYIVLIATIMFYGTRNIPGPDNSPLAPIVALSVFTLSAAVMGYLILLSPLRLYLDGKKKEGVNLFVQTIAAFAVITAIAISLLFSGVFK